MKKLRLYYKIGYSTWCEEDFMYIDSRCFSYKEAISLFTKNYPASNYICCPIICKLVII